MADNADQPKRKQASAWRKAKASSTPGGACVEVRSTSDGGFDVRDSKNPAGPVLEFDGRAWKGLISGLKAGKL